MTIGLLASFAPSPQAGGPPVWGLVIEFGAIAAILYFLLIRPQRVQQKKHQALLASLKKGDQVVTSGGVLGEVVHIKEAEVTLRSGESRLVVQRSAITAVVNREAEAKSA